MSEEYLNEENKVIDNNTNEDNRTEESSNTILINKKQILRYSAFALVLIVIGFFMFGDNKQLTGNVITGNVVAAGGPGEIVEVKTVIQGFQYNPDTITVKKGSIVRLTIENKDNVLHGLHLPQFGVNGGTPGGTTKTYEFVAIETSTNNQPVPTCTQEHGETLTINVV